MIRMILTMNTFEFNDEFYVQKHGTAIGTKMAPAYANLFMGRFEKQALEGAKIKPYVWWRYRDDIFMIWTGNEDELREFIEYLNNLHPTIKFTSEQSSSSVAFFDTTVSLKDGKISTDLYVKPTDTHQYLLSSSCHPYHTKRSIPYSLGLRLRRICSNDTAFNKRCDELAEHLKKRRYKEKLILREVNKAKQVPRDQALKPSVLKSKCTQGIPFVVTYNPASPNLNKIISKHFPILQSSNRCREVFSEKPFIAYRRSRNLRDFLVKAKVKNTRTQTSPPRIKKCNSKKCKTCAFIHQDGLSSCTLKNTGQVHHIKQTITCASKNLIYMIQC